MRGLPGPPPKKTALGQNNRDIELSLPRLSPLAWLALAALLGIAFSSANIWLATQQPWRNLDLRWQDNAATLQSTPLGSDLPAGTIIIGITDGNQLLLLQPEDFIEEPDGNLPSYSAYDRFIERQQKLFLAIQSTDFRLVDQHGNHHTTELQDYRPASDLPPSFWVQIIVGLSAWVIAAAVGAFRPKEASARYLTLSGASTLLFASLAAVYSTRELAINGALFRTLSDLNFLGGLLFAATLVALLWTYPKRLGPVRVPNLFLAAALVWFSLQQTGLIDSMMLGRRWPVLLAMLASFALAYLQWRGTREDPLGRAALQWLLISWLLTSSAFCGLIFVPQFLGMQTGQIQGYSFLLFLLLYVGLAFGILRYRLFGLGKWWSRVLSSVLALVIISLFDLLFAMSLQLSNERALGLAVIAAAFVWLPLRSTLWDRLAQPARLPRREWFNEVVQISFASNTAQRNQAWQSLLIRCFDPLHCETSDSTGSDVRLEESGLHLQVPGDADRKGLKLSYAMGGRRLFSLEDRALVRELLDMLNHARGSRDAFQHGVDSERARIARDLHDNIGSSLLAGLHRKDLPSTRQSIRGAIAEMRTIVNGLTGRNTEVAVMLADLRYECESRLADVDISLEWVHDTRENPSLPYGIYQNFVSIIREIVSNVINHAKATRLTVTIDCADGKLVAMMEDDGIGLNGARKGGHGLLNLHRRMEELGGELVVLDADSGTALQLTIPLAGSTLRHPADSLAAQTLPDIQSAGGENADQINKRTSA